MGIRNKIHSIENLEEEKTGYFQISLELQEHSAYKIFLFPRGWFYDKRTQQKLEFIDVRKGENVKIQLSLQVRSSLPEQNI